MKTKLVVPTPPSFSSVEEERRHRKERLAGAFRLFSKFGFDEGVAGHITVRDPEIHDCFWVNPFGMLFSQIKVSDLLFVNHHGEVGEGNRIVNAAAHAHSLYGNAWSSLGRLLDPITQDACVFYEDHSIFDDYTGVVLDIEEGERIARSLGNHKAVILRNHGLLTVLLNEY